MPTKTIKQWLIIDWKTGNTRTRKSKASQSELGTNELQAKIDIEVNVPEVDIPSLALEIDVPEPQVYAATLEAIDDEDLPDWAESANEVIEQDRVAIQNAADGDLDRIAESLTARTLLETPGRPDPEHVRDYILEMVYQMRNEGGDE